MHFAPAGNIVWWWFVIIGCSLTSLATSWSHDIKTRRNILVDVVTATSSCCSCSCLVLLGRPGAVVASGGTPTKGLAARLAQRDPFLLRNSVFNLPPPAQIYPTFLRGRWNVTCGFSGYLFPSKRISRERLTKDFDIPGFQKCSIVATCDVGKEFVNYEMRIDETTGLEDRISTFTSQVDGFLGYRAVKEVIYDVRSNPNRISMDFFDYRTRNAERIELFCNARESQFLSEDGLFVCSEYIKQVTFGSGPDVGVARQVAGNYAHFWTWWKGETDDTLSGNLLTAAFLDPQDPLYFEEPSMPVAVYSHALTANRVADSI